MRYVQRLGGDIQRNFILHLKNAEPDDKTDRYNRQDRRKRKQNILSEIGETYLEQIKPEVHPSPETCCSAEHG